MKSILKSTFLFFNKVKVVHSIPGRLRLSLPGLDKIPDTFKEYEARVVELIKEEDGINNVSFSYITNKVLVTYDPKQTSEKEIVSCIDIVWKELANLEELFDDKDLEKSFNKIAKRIQILIKKG